MDHNQQDNKWGRNIPIAVFVTFSLETNLLGEYITFEASNHYNSIVNFASLVLRHRLVL
jgi:hypothetical protein